MKLKKEIKERMTESIEYKNHRIRFHSEGSGEIIIFLHGWPTNSRLWKSQVDALKSNYKVVTLDWLGFGESDKPMDHKYTFSEKKAILDIVLTNLLRKNESVNIIAHDIGGPPAILWTSENQEHVKRLILLNTVIFPFSTKQDKISHFFFSIPIIREVLVSHFGLRLLMKKLANNRKRAINNEIKEIIGTHENLINKVKLKTILEPLMEGKKNELLYLSEKFKGLKVNKYLVIAKEDPLCFEHMKKLSEDNPGIPFYLIENCGHFIAIDRPNKLNEVLIRILENKDES